MLDDLSLTEGKGAAGLPARPAASRTGGLRESIRGIRGVDGLLLVVLDDDPTGAPRYTAVQIVTALGRLQAASGAAPSGQLRAHQYPQPG